MEIPAQLAREYLFVASQVRDRHLRAVDTALYARDHKVFGYGRPPASSGRGCALDRHEQDVVRAALMDEEVAVSRRPHVANYSGVYVA